MDSVLDLVSYSNLSMLVNLDYWDQRIKLQVKQFQWGNTY